MRKKIFIYTLLLAFFLTACNKDDGPKTEPEPENQAPGAFDLASVEDKEKDVDFLPSFSWEEATDPDGDTVTYDFAIAEEDGEFETLATGLTNTSFDLEENLNFLTAYQWKVTSNDGNGGSTESETYTFTTRQLSGPTLVTDDAVFQGRSLHDMVSFGDNIWIIGGEAAPFFDYRKDVWASPTGTAFQEVTVVAPFGHRLSGSVVTFQDKMWVVGGISSEQPMGGGIEKQIETNDVWVSNNNGIAWTGGPPEADFSKRAWHSLVAFKDKLWVIGGLDEDGQYKNDVWQSEDGVEWDLVTFAAEFLPRALAQCVVFDGKLWLIGGADNDTVYNDIWQSDDGLIWTEVTPTSDFSDRNPPFNALVFRDKLFLVDGTAQSDIWYSDDGLEWQELAVPAPYGQRTGMKAVAHKNRIYFTGGRMEDRTSPEEDDYKNDVWVIE